MSFLGACCPGLALLDLSWCLVSNAEIAAFCAEAEVPPLKVLRLGGGEMINDDSIERITSKFGFSLEEIDLRSNFTITNEWVFFSSFLFPLR